MPSSRLLLVEEDSARADRIVQILSAADYDVLCAADTESAKEALGLRQFDLVLISSREGMPAAAELETVTGRLSSPAVVLAYGSSGETSGKRIIPASVTESDLPAAIAQARKLASIDRDDAASQLPVFELASFRQQMADDTDLMKEIIGIFFEESAEQLGDIRNALDGGEYGRAARLAHSLKGSLGSLHAPRARYWAQALEASAVAGDLDSSKRNLGVLEQSISGLNPELRRVLDA
jgi:HPt (histidine-containing phosphotransfer) domain-containing protein